MNAEPGGGSGARQPVVKTDERSVSRPLLTPSKRRRQLERVQCSKLIERRHFNSQPQHL